MVSAREAASEGGKAALPVRFSIIHYGESITTYCILLLVVVVVVTMSQCGRYYRAVLELEPAIVLRY